MSQSTLLPIAALLVLSSVAQAQSPLDPRSFPVVPYPMAARANPGSEAAATLREGIDKLLEFLGQEERPNKLQVAAFLDATIAPYFDFDYMAEWVAGRGYSNMAAEQREALAAALEARFLGTLAGRLTDYKGQQIRYFRPRRGPRGAVNVAIGILRPGSYPSKLEFRMYRSEAGWKVYDVLANGRSAVAFYRRESRAQTFPGRPGPYGG